MRRDQKLYPNESHLPSPGHQLLATRYGNLNVLGTVHVCTSESLASDASLLDVAPGLRVRTLSLEKNVELKEQLNRDKDVKLERGTTPSDPTT